MMLCFVKGIVHQFGEYAYLLSLQELDEKINTTTVYIPPDANSKNAL